MPMTPHERAKRAAAARWATTSPEQRRQAAATARAGWTSETRLRALRTQAARLGYRLVPEDTPEEGA